MSARPTMRVGTLAVVLALGVFSAAERAYAQQQSVGLNLGYFALRGEDARIERDVLTENLDFLTFSLRDFNNASIAGEWVLELGPRLETAVGVGFYRRTVPSVYAAFVNRDGSEIEQDLKLRILPLSATLRFLPLGTSAVQPYVGGGVGLYRWRYSEVGEFVDFRDNSIFRDRYLAEGTDFGPIVLGGIRVPVGPRFATGGEIRYQRARGDLDDRFLGDQIDLGGYTYQWTIQMRF